MLNLKGVVLKLHNRDGVTLVLRKGRGRSGRRHPDPNHDVEIVNPSVIAHLSAAASSTCRSKVEKGRGYVPGTMRRYGEPTKSIGRIVLDALVLAGRARELPSRARASSSAPTWTSW